VSDLLNDANPQRTACRLVAQAEWTSPRPTTTDSGTS